MTKIPYITIGIASYNYAQYLAQGFQAIKQQSFTDFEIIYCDDGSTDNSVEVIKKLIMENPEFNIRLIEDTNKGIITNRNRILDYAHGTYLMICDADDYMLPSCLLDLCSMAQVTDADCVIGGFEERDSQNRLLKRHIPNENSCQWLYTWHHAQIYKTEIFRKHKIRFDNLPDDVMFLQRIHLYSRNTHFVCKPLYIWTRHADSVSRDFSIHTDWNPVGLWENITRFIAELEPLLQTKEDQQALIYYLYKWFYFNVADLNISDFSNLKRNISTMQEFMRYACPDYCKIGCLGDALHINDTFFAHIAVALCWVLEHIQLLPLIPFLRTQQCNIRMRRERHGKT